MQNETNQAYKIRSLVLYRVGKRAIFVFSRVRFERFSGTPLRILAFHASVFKGARISSLPTNGRNTSSPKNACVGGYTDTHSIQTPVYDGQFRLSRRKDYLVLSKTGPLIRIWIMMGLSAWQIFKVQSRKDFENVRLIRLPKIPATLKYWTWCKFGHTAHEEHGFLNWLIFVNQSITPSNRKLTRA